MKRPIYMDYMATTPVDPAVVEKMKSCLELSGTFGNSASQTHRYGWEAAELIQQAREQVAGLIHADPREIVWTSGATEADNLALKGAMEFYHRKGDHLITMTTEHKAILDTCQHLEGHGMRVTYLDPESNGVLDLAKLEAAIAPDTVLVSVMHVNNETGVIQDIAAISQITRKNGVLFHVDAAQSVGKLPIDLTEINADLMSFSGHKLYGPKGVGVLYVRRKPRIRLMPQIHGGGHEKGLRSGTLPTHQIVGMGEAFAIATREVSTEQDRIRLLRDQLWQGMLEIGDVHLHGDPTQRIAGCLNIRFDGVDSESLLLSLQDIAVSSGSACSSAAHAPSHVLTALGLSAEQANRAIRLSIGRFTTEEDIAHAINHVTEQVNRLRRLSPLWPTVKANIERNSGNSR